MLDDDDDDDVGCVAPPTGITDLEIHFLQIKFTAIGVYLDPQILQHLLPWKDKKGTDLAGDDHFFQAVISSML